MMKNKTHIDSQANANTSYRSESFDWSGLLSILMVAGILGIVFTAIGNGQNQTQTLEQQNQELRQQLQKHK